MDIITQGLAGATLAQAFAPERHHRRAALIGIGAGLLPDADALIANTADPLLLLEFHRHFTHALVFIPVGAAVAALLFWPFLRHAISLQQIYRYALCGYASGGLLDACTSYGTHLLWPFSADPVAWRLIAIVDPVFTLALVLPLGIGLYRRRPARLGIVLALAYLLLGLVQHQRAEVAAAALAHERGHDPQHLLVKPSVGNLVLWRALYVVDDSVWVDAVRVGTDVRIYRGTNRALFDPDRDLTWATAGSRARSDADRPVPRLGTTGRGWHGAACGLRAASVILPPEFVSRPDLPTRHAPLPRGGFFVSGGAGGSAARRARRAAPPRARRP